MALPVNAVLLSKLKHRTKFTIVQKASLQNLCTLSPVVGSSKLVCSPFYLPRLYSAISILVCTINVYASSYRALTERKPHRKPMICCTSQVLLMTFSPSPDSPFTLLWRHHFSFKVKSSSVSDI
jgi:hypothetical protein